MPTPAMDTSPCGLAAHPKPSKLGKLGKPGNKPVYAWDAPNHCDPKSHRKNDGISGENEDNMLCEEKACQHQHQQQQQQQQQQPQPQHLQHHQHHHHQPSFYDQEALQEKLRGLEAERSGLSAREDELRERLHKAQVTLSSMRSKKRQLSTAKLLDQADKAGGNSGCSSSDKQTACSFRDRMYDQQRAEHRKDGRAQRQDENNVFAAKERIMEIDLLNDQLRKGQANAELEARSHEAASCAAKAELERMQKRLQAMPKRFTESLQLLRNDVDSLEREKLTLELAKQQRSLKEVDLLASMQRRQTYMTSELNLVLDEINDVEDHRDKWKRRLRVESTLVDSLQSKRDRALGELRKRFGEDAVERAAFAGAACRENGERKGWGKDGRDGGSDSDRRSVSISMIPKALAPAYGADGAVLTDAAVVEAARECRFGSLGSQQQPEQVGFEEFCAISQRLRRGNNVA